MFCVCYLLVNLALLLFILHSFESHSSSRYLTFVKQMKDKVNFIWNLGNTREKIAYICACYIIDMLVLDLRSTLHPSPGLVCISGVANFEYCISQKALTDGFWLGSANRNFDERLEGKKKKKKSGYYFSES